jgi:hypothetical protein
LCTGRAEWVRAASAMPSGSRCGPDDMEARTACKSRSREPRNLVVVRRRPGAEDLQWEGAGRWSAALPLGACAAAHPRYSGTNPRLGGAALDLKRR